MSGLSGALRNLAIEMGKIASDIILLNSGPQHRPRGDSRPRGSPRVVHHAR